MIRFSEDYSGTIKSSTHRRRTTGSVPSTSSSSACHNHQHLSHTQSPIASTGSSNKVPSTLELENSKTKYKLDQLRLVMQQKKERREARKLKNLPYHTNRVPVANLSPTTTTTITALASPSTTQPPASSPTANVESIIEEVDTVA